MRSRLATAGGAVSFVWVSDAPPLRLFEVDREHYGAPGPRKYRYFGGSDLALDTGSRFTALVSMSCIDGGYRPTGREFDSHEDLPLSVVGTATACGLDACGSQRG